MVTKAHVCHFQLHNQQYGANNLVFDIGLYVLLVIPKFSKCRFWYSRVDGGKSGGLGMRR